MINIKNLSNLVIMIDEKYLLPNESDNFDIDISEDRTDIKRLLSKGFIQVCNIPNEMLKSDKEITTDEPELLENSVNLNKGSKHKSSLKNEDNKITKE